ncbi:rhomboid family intramembrane serine protease [Candidatus Fermentibacteria bacterium]|nr:rhomboid family intramembrane serine protease [Candidatus Fermentibacteria bacterium]
MIPIRDENPVSRAPVVTRLLIAVNIAVFLLSATGGLERAVEGFGAVPRLVTAGLGLEETPDSRPPAWHAGVGKTAAPRQDVPPLLTLVTCMFLHGGLMHLAGNMWFLWIFGDNVEDRMGRVRFLLFYLVCGLCSSAVHIASDPSSPVPMIGASGAISGVMGAYMRLFPGARVITLVPFFLYIQFVRIPAAVFLGVWFLLQVVSSGSGGDIAWYAHIGGFVAGLVLAGMPGSRRRERWR